MNSTIDQYMTIPFRDGGRDRTGVDCWGLVKLFYKDIGIDLPNFEISCWDVVKIGTTINVQKPRWIALDIPSAPCVALMHTNIKHPGVINHIGIYVGSGIMLHVTEKIGVHKTRINDLFYKKTIEGFYAYVR